MTEKQFESGSEQSDSEEEESPIHNVNTLEDINVDSDEEVSFTFYYF